MFEPANPSIFTYSWQQEHASKIEAVAASGFPSASHSPERHAK